MCLKLPPFMLLLKLFWQTCNSRKKNSYYELINAKVALRFSIFQGHTEHQWQGHAFWLRAFAVFVLFVPWMIGKVLLWAWACQGSVCSTISGIVDSMLHPRPPSSHVSTMSMAFSSCLSSHRCGCSALPNKFHPRARCSSEGFLDPLSQMMQWAFGCFALLSERKQLQSCPPSTLVFSTRVGHNLVEVLSVPTLPLLPCHLGSTGCV